MRDCVQQSIIRKHVFNRALDEMPTYIKAIAPTFSNTL